MLHSSSRKRAKFKKSQTVISKTRTNKHWTDRQRNGKLSNLENYCWKPDFLATEEVKKQTLTFSSCLLSSSARKTVLLGHAQGASAMTTAARNASINSNQFEIVQLAGAKESRYENTKILQFHPGQAICRCKVSSNGRVHGPEHKECTVYARCCSYMSPIVFRPFKKFHVRSRAVTVQKCAK